MLKEKILRLPASDYDLTICLASGEKLVLQYRIETETIDVCLPAKTPTIVWKDCDMTPARIDKHGNTLAEQICLQFTPYLRTD